MKYATALQVGFNWLLGTAMLFLLDTRLGGDLDLETLVHFVSSEGSSIILGFGLCTSVSTTLLSAKVQRMRGGSGSAPTGWYALASTVATLMVYVGTMYLLAFVIFVT